MLMARHGTPTAHARTHACVPRSQHVPCGAVRPSVPHTQVSVSIMPWHAMMTNDDE